MSTSGKLVLSPPTRQSRLAAWFKLYGVDRAEVARRMGVSPQMVSKICAAEAAPPRLIEAMRDMGFPGHLLPRPTAGGNGRTVAQ